MPDGTAAEARDHPMLVAISIEHDRDHDDGPALPRKGCNGCRMIEFAWQQYDIARARTAERDEAYALVRRLKCRWLCQDCGSDLGDERYCRACVKTRFVPRDERDRLAERLRLMEELAWRVFECLDVDLQNEQIVHVLDEETRTKVMAPELARAIDKLAITLQAGARGEKP